ncbi:MAG: DUF934 domain-containing protein [Rubrivivax sp.]|nr:DUF934 domain-containing protein [Rubrivivax sp.]
MDFIASDDSRWTAADDLSAPQAHRLLTLEQWQAVRAHWPVDLPTGVLLPNTADVTELAADLPRLALVVLQFPKWTDGRAYSQARLLRTRLRHRGEIRATGDVLVDMVPLLQRNGFSSAQLRGDQKLAHAQRALRFFDGHYQADVAEPTALFARAAG